MLDKKTRSLNMHAILRLTSDWCMGLLPDTHNGGLHMRRECRERFPRHRFQRKPIVNDPGIHHGTCVTHVPWCMSGSLTRVGGENVPDIPGACATRNFTYLVRGPLAGILERFVTYVNILPIMWLTQRLKNKSMKLLSAPMAGFLLHALLQNSTFRHKMFTFADVESKLLICI